MPKLPHNLSCAFLVLALSAEPVFADADDDELKLVAPLPGIDKVEPMAPDWCPPNHPRPTWDKNRAKREIGTLATNIQRSVQRDIELGRVLSEIATAACDYPDLSYAQRQVAIWRQRWLNGSGLSEKEDRRYLKEWVRAKPAWDELIAYCKSEMPKTQGAIGFFAQSTSRYMELIGACEKDFDETLRVKADWSHAFWLDNPLHQPSQRELLGFVYSCVPQIVVGSSNETDARYAARDAALYCAAEVKKLDKKKIEKELEDKKVPPVVVARYMALFAYVQKNATEAQRELEALGKLVPSIKPLLTGAFEQAMADWHKTQYLPNKAAYDAGFNVELAVGKAAPEHDLRYEDVKIGCDPIRKAWTDYHARKKPKAPVDVVNATHEPLGYFLATHLALCDAAEGRGEEAMVLSSLLQFSPRLSHGAHIFAGAAIFDATRKLKSGDISSSILTPSERENHPVLKLATFIAERSAGRVNSVVDKGEWGGSALADFTAAGSMSKARIQSVKQTKTGVQVVFKKEQWSEPTYSCVNDGFSNWDGNGRPVYFKKCKLTGMEKKEFKFNPVTFVGATASLAKPGLIAKFSTLSIPGREKESCAYLVETDAAGPINKPLKPMSYLGVPLKK